MNTIELYRIPDGFTWIKNASNGDPVAVAPRPHKTYAAMCRVLATSAFPHELRWRKPVGGKNRLIAVPDSGVRIIDKTK